MARTSSLNCLSCKVLTKTLIHWRPPPFSLKIPFFASSHPLPKNRFLNIAYLLTRVSTFSCGLKCLRRKRPPLLASHPFDFKAAANTPRTPKSCHRNAREKIRWNPILRGTQGEWRGMGKMPANFLWVGGFSSDFQIWVHHVVYHKDCVASHWVIIKPQTTGYLQQQAVPFHWFRPRSRCTSNFPEALPAQCFQAMRPMKAEEDPLSFLQRELRWFHTSKLEM